MSPRPLCFFSGRARIFKKAIIGGSSRRGDNALGAILDYRYSPELKFGLKRSLFLFYFIFWRTKRLSL
jgi:hypothetical protein